MRLICGQTILWDVLESRKAPLYKELEQPLDYEQSRGIIGRQGQIMQITDPAQVYSSPG